jgi:PAS domain S-box-containing protein
MQKFEDHCLTIDIRMLEDNPAAFYLADDHGRILYFNPAMKALFGYGEEEYSGKHISMLEQDPDTTHLEAVIVPGEESGWHKEITAVSKEGRTFPCQIIITRLVGRGEKTFITLGMVRDNSEHLDTLRILKSHSDRLGALASIASRISIYSDIQRLSREALQAVAHMVPIKSGFLLLISEETGALTFHEGFNLPQKDHERYHADTSWDHCLEGQVIRDKSTFLIEDVSKKPHAVHCVPGSMSLGLVPLMTQERAIGVLSVTTAAPHRLDQSDMEFLLVLGSHLGIYIENSRLLKKLQKTNRRLAQQNQDLAELLSIISHDLRSPLATIGGYSSLIMEKGEKLSPDERSHLAKTIFQKTQETSGRFDDLLALFRISFSQEENRPESVDVREVLEAAWEEAVPADVRNRFTIRFPEQLPRLLGHVNHLTHLFANLFSNASKFMGQKENPLIVVGYEKVDSPEGIAHRFTVTDNGQGIPADYLPDIFKPFTRVPTEKKIPGSGVGLAAVRRIVRNHRGTVDVQSKEGEGTTFTITLPWQEIGD